MYELSSAVILDITKYATIVLLKLSLPILLVSLLIGVVISMLQALTQIQDQTISFVPKFIAISLLIIALSSYIGRVMLQFTNQIVDIIVKIE